MFKNDEASKHLGSVANDECPVSEDLLDRYSPSFDVKVY